MPGGEGNPGSHRRDERARTDISREFAKPWTDEIVCAAGVVVSMGCGDACPVSPGKRYLEWTPDDPAGKTVADVRPIRDVIERRVRALLDDLGVPAQH
ncbi:arsenate reductase ArsC [Streptomyces sp. NPDC007808]|uniref:arsenate reductase ArsC n=1 Tax=Streptomyces sp. NPDC007808 TaxID=3364779 RepID=UPI00367E095E